MQKQVINTFSKGLNQDLAKNKFDNEHYYDAKNIRIITDNGLSSYAVENTKGTKFSFNLPNLDSYRYENGAVVVPALSNLSIIGWCYANNSVIVITQASDNGTIYNQIWKLEFNETTDQPLNLNNGYLDPAVHLLYNRNLNLSNKVKCIAIYETDLFFRLYITDTVNPLLVFNLNGIDPLNTPQRTLNINPSVNLTLPIISELGLGNLPNGCIQYFYRLIDKNGSITAYSPLSNLFQLNNGNEEGLWHEYPAIVNDQFNDSRELTEQQRLENSSENGCKVTIQNIDKDYDYIQVGYVLWTTKDVPQVYLLNYDKLKYYNNKGTLGSKYYSFYHDGNEQKIPTTIEDLNSINSLFDVVHSFDVKDNSLYVANTTNTIFDIDSLADNLEQNRWDARAYRFNASNECKLLNSIGSPEITFTYPNYPNVSTEYTYDCIHPENALKSALTYKYNPGLTIDSHNPLGGIGPNVSYRFTTEPLVVDVDSQPAEDTITTPTTLHYYKDEPGGLPLTRTFKYTPSSGTIVDKSSNSYWDLKSPYLASKYTGYQRGETYRFSIKFYDKQGRPSYNKWISDIKFPEFIDSDVNYNTSTYEDGVYDICKQINGTQYNVSTLGIEFTITLPEWLKNNISGYSIDRVIRQEEDKTRLGTGITGRFQYAENRKFTVKQIFDYLTACIKTILLGSFVDNGTFWGGVISDKIEDLLNDHYNNLPQSLKDQYERSADKGDIETLINTIFEGAVHSGGIFGLSAPIKLFSAAIGKLVIYLISDYTDILYTKIGNVDDKIFHIGYNSDESRTSGSTFYVISPNTQFDKYSFKQGDYVIPFKDFDIDASSRTSDKIYKTIHRYTNSGLKYRTDSTTVLRKWYNGSLADSLFSYDITYNSILDVGDILKPTFDNNTRKATYINACTGWQERYVSAKDTDEDNDFIGNNRLFSYNYKIYGIGDKKQILNVNGPFYPENTTRDVVSEVQFLYNGSNAIGLTYQSNSNQIFDDLDGTKGQGSSILKPRIIDVAGDTMISFARLIQGQYGGASLYERALNNYIECEYVTIDQFNKNSVDNTLSTKVYKGDTYVGLYGAVNYNYYFEQLAGYDKATKTKKALIDVFPTEQSFNFNLREGKHVMNSLSTDDLDTTEQRIKRRLRRNKIKSKFTGIDEQATAKLILPKRFLFDEFKFDEVYTQERNAKLYVPRPFLNLTVLNNKNRIWKSNTKNTGELVDNFRKFAPLNYIDVELNQGSIADVFTFKNQLYYIQNNGIGIVTTNEKNTTSTNNGSLTLSTSTPLSRYDYLSKEMGTNQRFSVVRTDSFFTFYDPYRKKIFKIGEGVEPLTDLEGLASKFRNTNNVDILSNNDSIIGCYYPEFNSLYYTVNLEESYTLSYNLLLGAFESFHDVIPSLYLTTPNRVLIWNNNTTHTLLKGNRGEYFGNYYPSYVQVLVNDNPSITKVFDNLSLYTEVTNNGSDIPNESITKIQVSNDYQSTGLVTLNVKNNNLYTDSTNVIKRKNRRWELQIPRDSNNSANTTLKSRIRDNYALIKLQYDNNSNKKFILQDIVTTYRTN